jgi:hypothetical protein
MHPSLNGWFVNQTTTFAECVERLERAMTTGTPIRKPREPTRAYARPDEFEETVTCRMKT